MLEQVLTVIGVLISFYLFFVLVVLTCFLSLFLYIFFQVRKNRTNVFAEMEKIVNRIFG